MTDTDTQQAEKPVQNDLHEEGQEAVQKPEEEAINFKEKYARALADYNNLQRQVQEERKELFHIAQSSAIMNFIPTLDMLQQAEVFVKDTGLKMVIDMFKKTLADMGLSEVELKGKPFDPHTAEAIETVEGERDDEVVEVVKSAYKLGDKIVRVGQVKVSKKLSEQDISN